MIFSLRVRWDLVRTEWKNENKKYIENLININDILESKDDYSSFGGKERAIKRLLQKIHGDDLRARVVNEFINEIKSRFTLDQMVVLIDSFEDEDMCPAWLWG